MLWAGGSFVNNSVGMRAAEGNQMNGGKEEKPGGRTRRQFDEAYKRHAVDLTLQGGRSVRAIAKELGVTDSMLHEWRRLYAPRPGVDGGAPATLESAQQEIARLRGELVRMHERETVLKKSLGILSEAPRSGMPESRR